MTNQTSLTQQIEEALREIPMLDAHTHLHADHLSARDITEVALYHMVGSDLCSAGWQEPVHADPTELMESALPYFPYIRNTSCYFGVRAILRDLYEFDDDLTEDNWQAVNECIVERSSDVDWGREILKQAGIVRAITALSNRAGGQPDDCLQYTYETSSFAGPLQDNREDSPLLELEQASDRSLTSLEEVTQALEAFLVEIPLNEVITYTFGMGVDLEFPEVSESDMAAAVERRRRDNLTPGDRHLFAGYLLRRVLDYLEPHDEEIAFQFSYAGERFIHRTVPRYSINSVMAVGELVRSYPKLRFNLLLAAQPSHQLWCILAREMPNLSFAGYWWHCFFPGLIAQLIRDRLDMVALNKQVGFFSDAYCAEWAYAKAVIVRQELARVLAEKIESGQYSLDTALEIARQILYQTPQSLLGMKPSGSLPR